MTYSDVDLAFAAGLMEGEGTVRVSAITRQNKGCLVVSMTNTNIELVAYMQDLWPGYCKQVTGLRPDQKPAWRWAIAARRAMAFLDEIEPFVVSWRMAERIATARWWQQIKAKPWQYRDEEDYEESFNCWHWMAELNHRGTGL